MLFVAALAVMPACREEAAPVAPDRIVVGTAQDLSEPSPFSEGGLGASLALLVFRPLFRPAESGAPMPDLAERITWSADGRSATVAIRASQRFSDGSPVTAEDVVYTLRRVKAAELYASAELEEVTVAGPLLIAVRPSRPFLFPGVLFYGIARRGDGPLVGGGPYRVSRLGGQTLEMTLNALHDGGPAPIATVEFRGFKRASEAWSSLLARRVDLVTMVPWNKHEQLSVVPTVRLISGLSKGLIEIRLREAPPPFNRAAARRALALGIDRAALVREALHGNGLEASGIVWPLGEQASPDERPIPYAPDEARRLLLSAGCEARPDGTLWWSGAPLQIELGFPAEQSDFEAMALVLQRQLAEIGVTAIFHPLATVEVRARVRATGPSALLVPRHATSDVLFDEEVKALAASPPPDLSSPEAVAAAVREAQRRLAEEMPAIPLVWLKRLDVIDRRFCGLPSLADGPEEQLHRVHPCAPGEER